jgi:hypothetical protein
MTIEEEVYKDHYFRHLLQEGLIAYQIKALGL